MSMENFETKTILIVEDDPFIAMDLQDTFEDAGFAVLGPVADVRSGLELVKSRAPDVAMLDFNLGRENSLPIAETLEQSSVPYFFLSGQIETVIQSGCVRKTRVIAKPFNADALVAFVQEIVRRDPSHSA